MKHKNSLELFEYWNNKRANRAAPKRSDIEPADIKRLLPHIFICDLADDGRLTFRLAGTGLCALYGRELKMSDFGNMWLTGGVRNAARTGTSVAAGVTPAVLSLDCLGTNGQVAQAEMLLLPIVGPTERNDRLIGLISVFDAPYWAGHVPLAGISTTGIRFLDQERDPLFLKNRPEIQMPKQDSTSAAHPFGQRSSKAAHLFVVQGGRQD